jgi:arylsulfatase A-like enzyme
MPSGRAAAAEPPLVVLITIDTLRADHVHAYGAERVATPALDGLARDGLRFTQAFTAAPITNASHASILTGLRPSSHGVADFGIPLAPTHPTWAELLKARGYATAAFIGAVVLDSKAMAPGFDRGFDFYDDFPATPHSATRWGRLERRGRDVVGRAEAWLAAHASGPRFVWVHLYDPHDPYDPPPPFSRTYARDLYDGEVAYADSAVGHLLRFLRKQRSYDGALVIAVADHGEGLGEHKEETHGIFLYDSTLHVPLIVKLPGNARAGEVVDAPACTTDILPTVLDVLGVPPPARLDGGPLTGRADDPARRARAIVAETDYPLRFGWAPLRAIRVDSVKLIEAPRPELYDLRGDPRELANAYRTSDPRVKMLRERLVATLAPQGASSTTAPASSATAEAAEALRGLGYVGQSDAHGRAGPDPKDRIEEQNLLHDALLATEDRRPADARRLLGELLKRDPDCPAALQQLGHLELQAHADAAAALHLRRARRQRPDDPEVLFDLGRALDRAGDGAGAREALRSSLALDPRRFEARLLLGQILLRAKEARAAADQLEAALLLRPDDLEAKRALARARKAR